MLNSPNKELFACYTFNTSREFVEKEVSNLFSSSIYERLPFLEIDSEGKEKQSSVLVFDIKEIIKEEVVHNTNLLFDNQLALNPQTKWVKNKPVKLNFTRMASLQYIDKFHISCILCNASEYSINSLQQFMQIQ